jgi:2,3-bisphosphoglycerate-dependent phosphoglycerate mutase
VILIAVRHGETEWNLQRREMGQLDSVLTQRGVQQAEAIGRRLSGVPFHALYSSDLGRAVQTAEIIGALCQKDVRLDSGLRERHMGLLQGLTWEEMGKKFPKERETYERTGFYDVIPEGESAQQRLDRSVRVLTAIAESHPNQTAIVVTHGGFLTGFLEFVLGIPFGNGKRFKKQNASFNAFEYVGSKWCLETWNDVSHLNGVRALDDSRTAGP